MFSPLISRAWVELILQLPLHLMIMMIVMQENVEKEEFKEVKTSFSQRESCSFYSFIHSLFSSVESKSANKK